MFQPYDLPNAACTATSLRGCAVVALIPQIPKSTPDFFLSFLLTTSPELDNIMEDSEHSMTGAIDSNGAHVDGEPSSPVEAAAPPEPVQAPVPTQAAVNPAVAKAVDDVVYSDIGINTLLTRLKQSIASAKVR